MKTIISTLEDNIFLDVLIKKGINKIPDKVYNKLISSPVFRARMALGQIKLQGRQPKPAAKNGIDFNSMSYEQLKKYVKDNNIKTESLKKADILKALNSLN